MPAPDQEFWEEFLNMYKLYPCLWDSKSKEYSNKQLRENAVTQLVIKCKEKYPNADRNFVMKKIHSFRCAFRRELKKVVWSLKSGTSPEEVYVPSLWYYELLSFITDSEMPKEAVSNIENTSLTQNEESDGETQSETQDTIETNIESPATSPVPASSESNCSTKRPRKQQLPKYGRKSGQQEELLTLAKHTMKKFCTEDNASNTLEVAKLSDFEIAGVKFGRDLASLAPDQRTFVEKIVADAIFYGKRNKLTENSSLELGVHPGHYQTQPAMYHGPYVQHHTTEMHNTQATPGFNTQATPGLSEFLQFK